MTREEHEEFMNRLNDPEIPLSERTEVLSTLRNDYGAVLDKEKELSEKAEKLQSDKEELVLTNGAMFRQLGIREEDSKENTEDKKEEVISLEDIERNAGIF